MTESSLFDLGALDASPSPNDEAGSSSPTQTQSLYRKYRPQSFSTDEYYGQQHIVHTLQNAVALGRVAHAYLFCGPRGTGKTTTARLIAKAVNCLDPDPYKRPCNTCASCVAINHNATTDVIEIDAASNRGIDDIRDLRERVKYAPTQLKTKFYIIDEAHQITGAAANAFLKTLEEPPAHTKFVLATTDPEDLLPTIVSRCQRFDFRKIDLESMVQNLHRIAGLEEISIDEEALRAIARHATGSLRDAQGLLDQVAIYREGDAGSEGPIGVDIVRQILGVSHNDRIEKLASALADRNPAAALDTVASAVEDGEDVRQLGRQLTAYLRLLLHQRAGGSPDADEVAKALAARFSLAELTEIARLFVDIDYKIKHAAFPQLPLELALVDSATLQLQAARPESTREEPVFYDDRPDERPPIDAAPPRSTLRDRVRDRAMPKPTMVETPPPTASVNVEKQERQAPPKPVPSADVTPEPAPTKESTPEPSSPPATSGTAPTLESIVEQWTRIRADVKAANRRIEALLVQVDPAAVVGTRLVLTSPYEFHRNRVNSDEPRQVIEDVVSRLTGTRMQVTCVSRDEAQAMVRNSTAGSSKASAVAQPVATSSLENAPKPDLESASEPEPDEDNEQLIKAAMNIFDAEIID